jgi:hypothetical protein
VQPTIHLKELALFAAAQQHQLQLEEVLKGRHDQRVISCIPPVDKI